MRIAYMLTSLGIGGAEKQVIGVAERMRARGHSVLMIVLRERHAEQWPTDLDVVHLEMRKSPLSIARGLVRARHALNSFHPDLLHSHTYPANMMARALRFIGAAPAVLATIHNVYEGGRLRMLAYRLTDPLVSHTTAVSRAAAQRFIQLKAVPESKCSVVPNAIDTAEFAPDAERRDRTRAEMSAGHRFVWFAAGRITAAKDYPNLLHAFVCVDAEETATELWIAGEDGGDMISLESLAARLGLSNRVRWLGLRRDMPALLGAADGFVLSSAWEGMPLVIGEAMAMEKPVVATDAGGVRELLGETGILVPPKSAERLADAMRGVMRKTADDRRSLGRGARLRIEQKFSMESKAAEWEALYDALLGNQLEIEARGIA